RRPRQTLTNARICVTRCAQDVFFTDLTQKQP
ncbi:MAG: hypothetical protein ACI9A2_003348, partial [Halioglobus sp.]